MRAGGPVETCLNESDGVVSLRADDVRSIKDIKTLDAKQQPKVMHAVDAFWDTAEGRMAPDPEPPRRKKPGLLGQYLLADPRFDEEEPAD